ncbi:MAG: glycosyltransferase family 2 protein [Deltaproteobacteria bacterium]|nr:glycosyltransferase family 2 protein [Deltaproteobacteria bacterium]
MRTVSITCVKNEADIVEPFVRHTACCVDHVVVLDNGSTDETVDVLNALREEGLDVEVVHDASHGHWQWRRMTRLMHEYALGKYRADWIVPVDVDEFLVTDNDEPLPRLLQDRDSLVGVGWKTYVPDIEDDPSVSGHANPVTRIRKRLKEEAHPWRKVIVPSNLVLGGNARLTQGNHAVDIDGETRHGSDLQSVHLAHFPVRGVEQYASKVAIKHLQYLAMSERGESWGFHYRKSYQLLMRDRRAFDDACREAAIYFAVQDPSTFQPELVVDPIPYRGGELKYTCGQAQENRALRNILSYGEMLAADFAESERACRKSEKRISDLVTENERLKDKLVEAE